MDLTSRAYQLPVELMSVIIDWAGVKGLVLLSAVSTNWRAVAHSHPLFWRDIRLCALSSTALSFFHARLDRAQGRNINLDIHLRKHPSSWRVKSIVLPAITRHLSHIVTLVVTLRYDENAAALDALNVPAPNLRRLELEFCRSPASAAAPAFLLLPDLFARSSPKLVSVTLYYVKFPLQRILAFENVKSLEVWFEDPRFPVHAIFQQFPRLTALELVGSWPEIGPEHVAANKIDTRRLSSLELSMPASGYDHIFAHTPDLSSIPDVSCWEPERAHADLLLGHLDGPIEMEFRGPDWASHTLEITLRAPGSARSRTFIETTHELPEAESRGAFFDRAFAARVTTLRLSAQLAFLAPLFVELPACRTLEILLDNHAGLPSQLGKDMAPLRLPALETLAIRAVECGFGKLSAAQLSAFLIALVGHTGQRPTLRLGYVTLADSSSSLSHDFNLE